MNNLKVTNFAVSWKGEFNSPNTRSAFSGVFSTQALKPASIKYYANFAVVRYFNVKPVYIIFYSGHVNCTGIGRFDFIADAIRLFKYTFRIKIASVKVKAIAATSRLNWSLESHGIKHILKKACDDVRISIVSNRFTGLMFRFKNGGTVQLFYSGKINFLGGRSVEHLQYMRDIVNSLANDDSKMPTPASGPSG